MLCDHSRLLARLTQAAGPLLQSLAPLVLRSVLLTSACVQDGTLVTTKSNLEFPRAADDYKWFNKAVVQTVQDFHDEGYKVVIFRSGLELLALLANISPDLPGIPLLRAAAIRAASRRRWRARWLPS